ncbi:hypothetical protein ACFQ5J_07685 [Lacticaseibacillus baoqingensis]|uniref:DUF1129 family protein n=1 Tax=Lacticaseibacillus baoqingensis TaxID=2486013 RepID=A0ABW4E7Z6_9LACO|nr:hypothetical protein [Lacticaseibacillus baoqingensis]
MDKLQIYADGLFAQGDQRQKTVVLAAMEADYQAAIAAGQTPEAALLAVMSTYADAGVANHHQSIGIDAATANSFWRRAEFTARLTALGIAVLIGGLAIIVVASDHTGGYGAGAFFVTLAIGVVLLLIPRLLHRGGHKAKRVLIAPATQALAQQKLAAYRQSYVIGLCTGIGLLIVAIAPVIALNSALGVALMFLLDAIGCFFIIYVVTIQASYKKLLRPKAKLR